MRILVLIFALIFAGCGYKPLSYYAKTAFGKSAYVEIVIHPDFPKAGVNLKDKLNHAILTRLHLPLSSKEEAESILRAEISNLSFEMISQDTQGFANHYRAKVQVSFVYKNLSKEEYGFVLEGTSDYAATQSMTSLSIEKAQIDAIDLALDNIIDQFVSRIFYQGAIHKRKNQNNESSKLP